MRRFVTFSLLAGSVLLAWAIVFMPTPALAASLREAKRPHPGIKTILPKVPRKAREDFANRYGGGRPPKKADESIKDIVNIFRNTATPWREPYYFAAGYRKNNAVDSLTTAQIQRAVRDGASKHGYVVQRLEPDVPLEDPPAFILYTGKDPPQVFFGVQELGRLATVAYDKYHESGWHQTPLNLTFIGKGSPIDIDAAKLTTALRFQSDTMLMSRTEERRQAWSIVSSGLGRQSANDAADTMLTSRTEERRHAWSIVSSGLGRQSANDAADTMLTFRTEEHYQLLKHTPERGLSMEHIRVDQRKGYYRISQAFGTFLISVRIPKGAEALLDLAANLFARVREACKHVLPLIGSDRLQIDDNAYNKLPLEERHRITNAAINEAVKNARAVLDQQSGVRHGKAKIEIEIGKQKRSVRFAGLGRFQAIRIAATGQANASR